MAKMTGLGKGLDALFSDTKISELSDIFILLHLLRQ